MPSRTGDRERFFPYIDIRFAHIIDLKGNACFPQKPLFFPRPMAAVFAVTIHGRFF
jgi:hypothetical protein